MSSYWGRIACISQKNEIFVVSLQAETIKHIIIMQHPQSFNRSVLAQSYFPELKPMSAWKKLKGWMEDTPRLRPLLQISRRTYTPAEVQLIFSELGEP